MARIASVRRWHESIADVVGEDVVSAVMEGLDEPTPGAAPHKQAAWARQMLARLEERLEPDQCRQIMERRQCRFPSGLSRRWHAIWTLSETLDDYARFVRQGGFNGFEADGNALRIRISGGRCHCALVRGWTQPIPKTYCFCCAGHLRSGLEPVFGVSVDVAPESTVISGDPECWFVAHVGGQGAAPPRPPIADRSKVANPMPKPDRPIRARIEPFPMGLAGSPDEIDGLRAVHRLI